MRNMIQMNHSETLMAGAINNPSGNNDSEDMLKSDQTESDSESTATHLSSSERVAISMVKKSKKKSSDLHDTYNRAGE